ncbi:MAG: PqqD family protein [Oscillospiraceae bacterium]|jgi:hypothetical protein|nr:PqqD family protein [Oscillospiraceae bacterium]
MAYKLSYLEARSGFTTRKVGDAYMIVPTGPRMKEYKGVITINETAAFLFDKVREKRQSTPEMLQALKDEYGIDDSTAFEALSAFVEQCTFANLLVSETVDKLDLTRSYFMSDKVVEDVKQALENPELAKLAEELEAAEAASREPDPNEGATLFPEPPRPIDPSGGASLFPEPPPSADPGAPGSANGD